MDVLKFLSLVSLHSDILELLYGFKDMSCYFPVMNRMITADTRQPWTDSRHFYSEYSIFHFDHLIISFDYLIIG